MTPYVIDNQQRKHFIFLFLLGLIIAFALGYFLGYQQSQSAMPVKAGQNETMSPITPDPKAENPPENLAEKPDQNTGPKASGKTESEKDKKQSSTTGKLPDKSSKNTKDKSAPKKLAKKTEDKKPADKTRTKLAASSTTKPVSKPAPPKTVLKPEPVKAVTRPKPPAKPAEKPEIAKQPVQPIVEERVPATENTPELPKSEISAPAAKYSVQVGMFSGKDNALKFVNELKDSGFDAYTAEFTSSGTTKFNVRFGHFANREDAGDKLSEFKKLFTTPAYIVINK